MVRQPGPPQWTAAPWGAQAWLVTRYADVRRVLSDPRFIRDVGRASEIRVSVGLSRLPGGTVGRGVTTLHLDPPAHTGLRRRVSPLFTARRIERLRPMVDRLASELVDRFAAKGHADLVTELAEPLTVGVLGELAGLPPEDFERFGPWVRDLHQTGGGAEAGRTMAEAIHAMDSYLAEIIQTKQGCGTAPVGVLAELAGDSPGNGLLDDDELVAFGRDLLVGGYESTRNLITAGLLTLLTQPEALAQLHKDPALVRSGVEELLRVVPPFPWLEERYASEDLELGGVRISRGEAVVGDLLAANHDPARFPSPDAVVVADRSRGHLSFGPGTHHCLGAALARMQAEIAIGTVLTRLPEARLGCRPDAVEWLPGFSPGLRSLPVIFVPAPPGMSRCSST